MPTGQGLWFEKLLAAGYSKENPVERIAPIYQLRLSYLCKELQMTSLHTIFVYK